MFKVILGAGKQKVDREESFNSFDEMVRNFDTRGIPADHYSFLDVKNNCYIRPQEFIIARKALKELSR